VLWDIDHTLIETRGVGRAIYERVFPAVTGKPLRQLAEVAGRTELAIMHDTLRFHDVEPSEQMMRRLGRSWPRPGGSYPVFTRRWQPWAPTPAFIRPS
jgi:phosphoglycolate phosphatase